MVFINHFTWAGLHPLALMQTILRQEIQYQEAGYQQLNLLQDSMNAVVNMYKERYTKNSKK